MKRTVLALALVAFGLAAGSAHAGGALETFDITAGEPAITPGRIFADPVGIRWDVRCIPVDYSLNDTLDPVPNPLGAPVVTLAQAGAGLQDALDAWNAVRTSFIDMEITGATSNPGTRGFDFVNELTFRTAPGFGAIASSPSVSLIADSTFADGDDIDGDGDPDVSAAITTCGDADGDGDVEFPAGDYPAGTILDNDVQFNATILRFTVDPAAADVTTNSVDLVGVAVHEFGHSHGLSHVLNNQKSDGDGTSATMYPFIDTGDPESELSIRELDSDDAAYTSFFYPEGTAHSGPAKLQHGDWPFRLAYSVIDGEVTHGGNGLGVPGASVSAFAHHSSWWASSAISGTVRLEFDPGTGGLFVVPDPTVGIVDGRYELVVPKGLYNVGIEAIDGAPVATGSINFTAQVGGIYGQLGFEEEFYNRHKEAALEHDPGERSLVVAILSDRLLPDVDLVTNANARLAAFGSQDFIGFTLGPGELIYAVRFPRADVQAAFDAGFDVLQEGLYRTSVVDASTVPAFQRAALVDGVVNPDGTASLDLAHPWRDESPFVAQDTDFAPFYFKNPKNLSKKVGKWLDQGGDEDLFLVLQVPPEPWPGVSARAPAIGLDGVPGGVNDVPIFGLSYTSVDGGASFQPETRFNYMFGLVFSPAP